MSENNEQVEKLLGDFFERHTAGDKEGMNEVLQKIQLMLYSGETDSTPFKDYFNNMYTGRSAINVSGMVSDYPRESIIRELLQNVFGCDYDESDIKVMIEFLDEGQVKLTYNETGFTLGAGEHGGAGVLLPLRRQKRGGQGPRRQIRSRSQERFRERRLVQDALE